MCIPIGICVGIVGGYFVFRGIQSAVLLILKRVIIYHEYVTIIKCILIQPFPEKHDVTHHIGYVKRLFKGYVTVIIT